MKIAIVGWGVEGQSVYHYFGPEHDYLIVSEEPRDDFPAKSDKVEVRFIDAARQPGLTGNVQDLSYLEDLKDYDKIVYTPTVYKNLQAVYGDDKDFWDKATTVWHIFFEEVKSQNIIGVTGTKGKGTTSTLIAKMLEASGQKVWLGGNIGKSVLDFVKAVQSTDWVVLEISNFQLHNFPYSPHIAVCLMIAEEHMDWHPHMEEYIEAKANIFRHQTKDDIAIYLDDDANAEEIAGLSPGKKISYWGTDGAHLREDGMIVIGEKELEVIKKSEVKLLGEHNLQNICAALTAFFEAAWSLDPFDSSPAGESLRVNPEPVEWIDAAKQVLSSFMGLEHRLELVREFEEVEYYDDSFGTNPATTIVALRSFIQPVVIILGGSDKGADFTELAKEIVKRRVRQAIVVGQTANKITAALKKAGFTDITTGLTKMSDIVVVARKVAEPGDVVLLSTACASFGLFKDYKDRGDQFKSAVRNLN